MTGEHSPSADDTSSDDTEASEFSGPFFQEFTAGPLPTGDTIDGAGPESLTVERASGKSRRRQTADDGAPRDAKATPPSLDEWVRFFSNVVLRVGTEFYIDLAFRGIDEEAVTEHDLERLAMTDEERKLIATPFAELSHKSKLMRKHGRMIVASGDALNAVVVLGIWMGRVRRIAAKYRPKVVKGRVNGNGSSGSDAEAPIWQGSGGGQFPPGFNGEWQNPGSG